MKDEEILEKLSELVADLLDLDAVSLTNDTVADDITGWDSLAHVRIVVGAEELFDCRFTTSEITSLKCVGDLVKIIRAHRATE